MAHGGKRVGAGRKSKMEQMNYWGWMQDLLVAYLDDSKREQVHIASPVSAYVRSNGIKLSLADVQLKFGRQGYDHFHRWFNVKEEGRAGECNSVVTITTDMDVRTEVYNWLIETGASELIQESKFMAFEEIKANGELDKLLAKFKSRKV